MCYIAPVSLVTLTAHSKPFSKRRAPPGHDPSFSQAAPQSGEPQVKKSRSILFSALIVALFLSAIGIAPVSAAPKLVVYPVCQDLGSLISSKIGEAVRLCSKQFQGPVLVLASTAVMPQQYVLVAMIYAGETLAKVAITTEIYTYRGSIE